MSVIENGIDFNSYERKIAREMYAAGRAAMKEQLEAWDLMLLRGRETKRYRNNGLRQTTIKTTLGEVTYRRRVYERRNPDGTKSSVYLLDEAMKLNGCGLISGNLAKEIGKAACESSYRATARAVSEMTGQPISHMAAWNVVQALGERVGDQEEQAAVEASEHGGSGKLEAKLLFEEQDGIWLDLQGKDRKQYGSKKEMKLAIAYDGAKKVGRKRYELSNKMACANFEAAGKFQRRKEGAIAKIYNTDEIEIRLLNGDGAQWIRQAQTDETVQFQLDPFHRNKAVRQWVKNEDMRAEIMELLYRKDIDRLLVYIEALSNSVEDETEQENLLALLTYFTNNKDGLVPCHRRGLALPEPPEGKEYRHMGCIESNIFTILGNRMKGRRACWSIDGGNNLARLLCLKATGLLPETLETLSSVCLPVKYTEEVPLQISASKTPKYDGKGYEPVRSGAFPASPQYNFLREIGKINRLTV